MLKRTLTLNNVTKGYKKDFVFEITLDRSENTEIIQGDVQISIANAKLLVENFSGKKFEVNQELKLVIHNGSANIVVEENADVAKNLIRVKASEELEKVQKMNDNRQYDKAIHTLDLFEAQCDKYKGDIVIDDIVGSIQKSKGMSHNFKNNINNNCNVAAYNKNVCSAYMKQSSIGFCGNNLYRNRQQEVMQTNLSSCKNRYKS